MTRRFSIDDLLALQGPTVEVPPHLSPDGRRIAVSVQKLSRSEAVSPMHVYTPDRVPDAVVGSRVVIVDTTTGESHYPFPAGGTSWAARWSPDGSRLAAYVQHEGVACLGIWDSASGDIRLVHDADVKPYYFDLPQWTPDGRRVVVKLWPSDGSVEPPSARRAEAEDDPVAVFSFDPAPSGAPAPAHPVHTLRYACDVGVVDLATGDVRRVVRGCRVGGYSLAPDGGAIALARLTDLEYERWRSLFDLVVVSLDGTARQTVATSVPMMFGGTFAWAPEGRRLAYTTFDVPRPGRGAHPPGQLFVVGSDGSAPPQDLSAGVGVDLRQRWEPPRWSADGRLIYCLAGDGVWEFPGDGGKPRPLATPSGHQVTTWIQRPGDTVLRLTDDRAFLAVTRNSQTHLTGIARVDSEPATATVLAEFARNFASGLKTLEMDLAPSGTAAYLFLQATDEPAALWRTTPDDPTPKRLAGFTPGLEDVRFGSARLVDYRADDGQARRAAVLLPPDFADGAPVPLVVCPYGGASPREFVHLFGMSAPSPGGGAFAQLLASHGYAVLFPDIPRLPSDQLCLLPGYVLPAIDQVVDMGIGDPQRLGLVGQSYGGYNVLALLTRTEVFKAAISSAGNVNLTSLYGAFTIREGQSAYMGWVESAGRGSLGGPPWERRDAYVENSPLFYLDRVSTPVLLIAGEDDPPAALQASEAFSALRRLGRRVELRIYRGEGHVPLFWSAPNARDVFQRMLDWFDEHFESPRQSAPG